MPVLHIIKTKVKYISFCVFLCLVLFGAGLGFAQTLPQNLSHVSVDSYTDAQLRQWMQQAQSSGLSDNDLIQQFKSRGLSTDQAERLQTRITALRLANPNVSINDANATNPAPRKVNGIDDTSAASRIPNRSKIFGADLFRNNNTSFEPNLRIATPVNYILGPDDQLDINVYGNSLVNWKLTVTPEGNINIPGVGLLNVSGKTVEQATANIKSKLIASNYSIGRGTSVSVTLGNIRSIKVLVNGQVIRPGTVTVPSLATVFSALVAAGGPNDNGSFRSIEVIRNNKIVRHLDVYDFLTKGDQKDNISLQDQDIIRVPTYRVRVEMAGDIKVPALFEVLPGESLRDVIKFAGGFTDQAYTEKIKVYQISGQERRISDVLESDYGNYTPLRGDKYEIDAILNRYENRITVKGAVFRPGYYELSKGLTLSQLIAKASGLKEDAFSNRGFITRLKADNTLESIPFNTKAIVDKSAPDIVLQREDIVNVPSIFDLRDVYTVNITGQVRQPGEFPFAENMSVEDLILKAGGFSEGASPKRVEVARRASSSDPGTLNSQVAQVFSVNVDELLQSNAANFVLKPYDIISVYSLPGYEKQRTVKVSGEVLYPGSYSIEKKNEKISNIIARAGGVTISADVEGASLKRSALAILGLDKNKTDTTSIEQERLDRVKRLQRASQDSTVVPESPKNEYVGIDMKEILEKPGSRTDIRVEDQDEITIPKQQQIVKVEGQVLYPSSVVYESGKTLKDYVINAGGFSPTALKSAAYVFYPNGTVRGTRKFLFFNIRPSVRPGSTITIPKKQQKRGVTTQEVVGLAASVASLGAVILGIVTLSK